MLYDTLECFSLCQEVSINLFVTLNKPKALLKAWDARLLVLQNDVGL